MIRPIEDFQRAAIEHHITRWIVRSCSICGYPTGYLLGEGVLFDSGCDCSSYGPSDPSPRSWEDVADHYNRNQPENNPQITAAWLAEVDAFWHFSVEQVA